MHKKTLHEIAKFASGLVVADFIYGLWLYVSGHLPVTSFGITFDGRTTAAWLVFDALLFVFLVSYGWNLTGGSRTSREKVFHIVAGILFTLVALLHLARILFGLDFTIGAWSAPYWLNGLGVVVTALLAYASFHLARGR